jgi:hypothetical protein
MGGLGLDIEFRVGNTFFKKVGTIVYGGQSSFPQAESSIELTKHLYDKGVIPARWGNRDKRVYVLGPHYVGLKRVLKSGVRLARPLGRKSPVMQLSLKERPPMFCEGLLKANQIRETVSRGSTPDKPPWGVTGPRYTYVVKPYKGNTGLGPKHLRETADLAGFEYQSVIGFQLSTVYVERKPFSDFRVVLRTWSRHLYRLPNGPFKRPKDFVKWSNDLKSFLNSRFLVPLVVPYHQFKDGLKPVCFELGTANLFLKNFEPFNDVREQCLKRVLQSFELKRDFKSLEALL